MRRIADIRRQGFALLAAAVWSVWPAAAQTPAVDAGQTRSVLILYSGQFGLPGYERANISLWPTLLAAGMPADTVFAEYLDLARNPDPAYRDRLADFLKQKYAARKIGAIIAISTNAVSFVLDERYRMFEGVPVVAALPTRKVLPGTALHPLVILGDRYDIAGTLQDALDLLPETENVLVVNGVSEFDRGQESSAREQLGTSERKLRISYLSNLPADEILRRVAAPLPKTVILYLGLFQDAAGRAFIPDDFVRTLSSSATAPVFTLHDGWLDSTVGGSMTSYQEDSALAARTALRILNGEPLLHIPPTVIPTPNRPMFNWRQLRRWGLDASKLPRDSVIVGKPVSIWSQHPVMALGTVTFLALESLLILALLWHRRQKRLATDLLFKSEEKFRKFFTNVPDYCYIVSADGTIQDVNRAALAILGYAREELIGRSVKTIYAPRMLPRVEALMAPARQSADLRNEEMTIVSKDGRERTVLLNAAAARAADGTILFATSVQTDITERKQAEEALRQSEALLKQAEEMGQFGSASWDVATDTTTWSEGLYRIAGRDPHQPAPRHSERAALYTPESWARLDGAVRRAMASGQAYDLEIELLRPDGARRWVHAIGAPVRDETGRIIRLRGTLRDITARKQADDALRESEERFRGAFESAAIGMGLVAPDGHWLRVNQSLCRILGYPADELLASNFQSITHPEDLEGNLEHSRQLLDGTIPHYQTEKRYLHKAGRIVWVRLSVSLVRDPQGAPLYFVSQIEDITERKEADTKLRREKEFTDAVIDNVPGFFYLLDERGKAVRWNERAHRVSGYAPDEVTRMEAVEFFPAADRPAIAETLRRVFEEGHAEIEANILTKDGATIPYYLSAARASLQGENYLIGNGIDISERKKVEQSLRDSEEKFSKAFQNSPVIMTISRIRDGRYVEVNGTFERLTGWSREEVVGQRRDAIQIRTDPHQMRAASRLLLTRGRYRDLEFNYRTKSGEHRVGRLSAETIEFGGETCVLTVGQDITEQKRFEQELRTLNENLEKRVQDRTAELERAVENLQMLSQAIENGPAMVVITDPGGEIEYVNPKFCEATGYTREEVIGKKPGILKSGEHPAEFYEQLWSTIEAGETWRGEFCNRRKNGELYWESACISTVRDALGQPRHYVSIKADITELKQSAAELKHAKEAADAASRAKTTFLASMSHEIRTPLHAILGYTQLMLRDESLGPLTKENLKIVSRSGEHLLALITDVLETAKIESGRVKLDVAGFDPRNLLHDLAAMFRLRTAAKGLDFAVIQDENVPRLVMTDEGKLRQIVINLLANAVKFSDTGRIVLRASFGGEPERPMLAIEVEDTGVGIAASEMSKLFHAFEQTQSGHQTQSGTGLGLAISREYARLMGGDISVVSELGKGSTFRLEIPVDTSTADEGSSAVARGAGAEPAVSASLGADSLAGLPEEVTAEMRQAILTGDMDRFTRALPGVAERNAGVADALRELADRYDYDALTELLQ